MGLLGITAADTRGGFDAGQLARLTAVFPNGVCKWTLADIGGRRVTSGARNLGGSIATASGLVFTAATNDRLFRSFDARTGTELWATGLPASGHATPVTYRGTDGKQYGVIAARGGTNVGAGLPISDSLVAHRLP
jgi:glucose dehydrogenase